jgi:hypothetical protein
VIDGRIFYDCDYACVITNSNFTPLAYQLAEKAGVIMCANEKYGYTWNTLKLQNILDLMLKTHKSRPSVILWKKI